MYREHVITVLWDNVDIFCNRIEQLQNLNSPPSSFGDTPRVQRVVDKVYHSLRKFGHAPVDISRSYSHIESFHERKATN